MVQSTGDKVKKLIYKQTRKVIYFCEAGNISVNTSVHEIRKSIKRIRAWLAFFSYFPEDLPIEKAMIEIGEISRILTEARESYVNNSLFDKYFSNKQFLPERKVKQITDLLSEENQRQIRFLINENNYLEKIKSTILTLEQTVKEFNGNISTEIVRKELVATYSGCFDLYLQNQESLTPENLHKIRIRLNQLWHQFEAARPVQPKYFGAKTRQLNEITDTLGADHDNYVLSLCVGETHFRLLRKDERVTFENLIQHQHELMLSGIKIKLKQIFTEQPEDFIIRMSGYFSKTGT